MVLPEEDQGEYEEVLRGFRESFQPEGGAEEALVLRLAQGHWRSLRSRAVETGMLHTSARMQRREARRMVENCPEHLDLHGAIGVGFMVMPAERWGMYLRYDATISRDFFRTLDTLTKLQRLRQQKKKPALAYAAGAGGGGGRAELSENGIRSVSQNCGAASQAAAVSQTALAQEPTTAYEPKEPKASRHRHTSRRAQQAPDRFGRQQRDLQRIAR